MAKIKSNGKTMVNAVDVIHINYLDISKECLDLKVERQKLWDTLRQQRQKMYNLTMQINEIEKRMAVAINKIKKIV